MTDNTHGIHRAFFVDFLVWSKKNLLLGFILFNDPKWNSTHLKLFMKDERQEEIKKYQIGGKFFITEWELHINVTLHRLIYYINKMVRGL